MDETDDSSRWPGPEGYYTDGQATTAAQSHPPGSVVETIIVQTCKRSSLLTLVHHSSPSGAAFEVGTCLGESRCAGPTVCCSVADMAQYRRAGLLPQREGYDGRAHYTFVSPILGL